MYFRGGHRVLFRCVAVAAFLLLGCSLPPVTVPIDTLTYPHVAGSTGRLLIVFLPGNGDKPEAFDRRGMVAEVRQRGIPADMIAVNAHLGYYLNGSFVRRLREDVIAPAKAAGYERIWLAGNSLGGYGSLAYLEEHREDISGVVLLGPFVGEKEILREVQNAGGLQVWDPGPVDKKEWQKRLMLLLKDYERHADAYPPVYLGYGSFDKFSRSQQFLAGILPPERVIVLNGGHEWWTWRKLWAQFLEKGIIK